VNPLWVLCGLSVVGIGVLVHIAGRMALVLQEVNVLRAEMQGALYGELISPSGAHLLAVREEMSRMGCVVDAINQRQERHEPTNYSDAP